MNHLKRFLLLLLVFVLAHKADATTGRVGGLFAEKSVKTDAKHKLSSDQFTVLDSDGDWLNGEFEDNESEEDTDDLLPQWVTAPIFISHSPLFVAAPSSVLYAAKLFLLYCSLKLDC